jgi:peroxiredoxin
LLNENLSEFTNRGIKLISISNDSTRKVKKMIEKNEFNITFLVDRGARIAKSYNVLLTKEDPQYEKSQVDHAIPSKFLINSEGILVWQYIGAKTDRPSIEMLINGIEQNI